MFVILNFIIYGLPKVLPCPPLYLGQNGSIISLHKTLHFWGASKDSIIFGDGPIKLPHNKKMKKKRKRTR
jgi:hypothetical protein